MSTERLVSEKWVGMAAEGTAPMRKNVTRRVALIVLLLATTPGRDPNAWPQAIMVTQVAADSSTKIEGTLMKIDGRYYVIKNPQGKEFYILISRDTELAGTFKSGDQVEVWTSPIEYAIAIHGMSPKLKPEEIARASIQ